MFTINNESTLANIGVYNEVQNAFQLMPKQVEKLTTIFNLQIHYVNDDIITNGSDNTTENQNELVHDNAIGLFDVPYHNKNQHNIYISVNKHDTAYQRMETLIHEMGHFVDYVVGKTVFPDSQGYHYYSFNGGVWDNYHEQVCEVIEDNIKGDASYWTMQIVEQFAQYFAYNALGKIHKYHNEFWQYNLHFEDLMNQTIEVHNVKQSLSVKIKDFITYVKDLNLKGFYGRKVTRKEAEVFSFNKNK